MISRRSVLGYAAALPALGLLLRPALAATPEVFATGGVAINGYDPVAYFTDAKPVEGTADFATEWQGVMWHFTSAENQAAFEADPRAYAPQYGGYCAYAVSRGYTATTVPEAWTVHEGKLYLNFSLGVRRTWSQDIPGNIAKADANWPGVLEA